MVEIMWENPRHYRGWHDTFTCLREHPNRWALLLTCYTREAAQAGVEVLASGRMLARPGEWEFTAPDERIYGKYLGTKAGEVEAR